MPQIQQYTADAQVPGPFQTRQARNEDTGDIGNAVAGFGKTLSNVGAQIHKRDAQSEISDLSAKMAQAHSGFSDDLDDTLQNADPNDREISNNFMDQYDDKMGEIGDNLQTPEAQQYFERANAQMRGHFQVASMRGQASLAGENAVNNLNSTVSGYSASVQNDPSSFDNVKNLNAMSIQAEVENGTIRQTKADEFRQKSETELAKSALRGWIGIDPTGAQQQLKSGQWDTYLNGDVKYQLGKEAEQGINGQRIEAGRQQTLAQQQLASEQTDTQNQFLQKLQNNQLSAKDVLSSNLDPVGSGSKDQFLKMIDSAQSDKIKTDPGTYVSLFSRIHLPDGNPQKITDENQLNQYLGSGLTMNDLNALRTEVQGRKTDQGKFVSDLQKNYLDKVVSGQLTKTNPALGLKDPEGDTQYQKYLSWFHPAFEAQVKAGKDPVNLLTPGSPDYMGNNIAAFTRTPQQIMNSFSQRMSSSGSQAPVPTTTQSAAVSPRTVEPRRAGETPSQYRARTNK